MSVRWQVVLPLRVRPQPVPAINPGGDCAYCVLGGLVGATVQEVHDECGDDLQRRLTARQAWLAAARRWMYEHGRIEVLIEDTPMWPRSIYAGHATFGFPGHLMGMEWFAYVRMALEAGYYAAAWVDHTRSGPLGDGSDHVVLICGARERVERHPTVEGASTIHQEVLVSCSSRTTPDEEWVKRVDMLRDRGGFNVVLVRPKAAP